MANLILTGTLKPDVMPQRFEGRIRTTDYLAMWSLKLVHGLNAYHSQKSLMSPECPDVDSVELFEIPGMEGCLREDFSDSAVPSVMGQFFGSAEASQFIGSEADV